MSFWAELSELNLVSFLEGKVSLLSIFSKIELILQLLYVNQPTPVIISIHIVKNKLLCFVIFFFQVNSLEGYVAKHILVLVTGSYVKLPLTFFFRLMVSHVWNYPSMHLALFSRISDLHHCDFSKLNW